MMNFLHIHCCRIYFCQPKSLYKRLRFLFHMLNCLWIWTIIWLCYYVFFWCNCSSDWPWKICFLMTHCDGAFQPRKGRQKISIFNLAIKDLYVFCQSSSVIKNLQHGMITVEKEICWWNIPRGVWNAYLKMNFCEKFYLKPLVQLPKNISSSYPLPASLRFFPWYGFSNGTNGIRWLIIRGVYLLCRERMVSINL